MAVIKQYARRLLLIRCSDLDDRFYLHFTSQVRLTWSEVLERARGQTVDWYMYGGFSSTNEYVNGYLAPRLKDLYGIKLRQVPIKDIGEVISKILVEKQAGKTEGWPGRFNVDQWRKLSHLQEKRFAVWAVCRSLTQSKIGGLESLIGCQRLW